MTRTLFIGLDGATFTVLDEMTRDVPGLGVAMPFMAKFIENGVSAVLHSTPNPLTPPAWTSITTGKGPGEHGIMDFIRFEDKGEEVYFTLSDARDVRSETIWSLASRQDRSVVSLNFPMTAPPRPINGSLVPGFVPWRHLRRNSTPKELYKRLKALPDFSPKELAWDFDREKQALEALSPDETEEWVRYHLPREEQWFRIAEFLLVEDKPDLMAVMFDGADKIQHQAWQFLDPALRDQDQTPYGDRMRKVCFDYFNNLDGFIERLVTAAGPDVQVFMASDHGFTATTEVVRINTFLHEKGYLTWKRYEDEELTKKRNDSNFANVDWMKTLAFCPTPSSNGVVIRVSKDGGPGIPPEEYESFRERLIEDLYSLRHSETNEPVVRDVLKREEHFAGPWMNNAPDLTLVLRDYGFVSIRDLKPAVVDRECAAGTHHPDGVFFAGGAGIEKGLRLDPLEIESVCPMLMHSLGLPVPEDMKGRVAEEAFTADYRRESPLRRGEATLPIEGPPAGDGMGSEEKEHLMEQLKMLGYME